MAKVKIEKWAMIHFVAMCDCCDWDDAIGLHTRQDVRNAVRSHVLKTGHTVTIETGTATSYSLKD